MTNLTVAEHKHKNEERILSATRLMHVETNEYPLYLSEIIQRHPNLVIPATPLASTLRSMGYAVVDTMTPPKGDVVTEVRPILSSTGRYIQNYSVRNYTDDERAAHLELLKQIVLIRLAELFHLAEERGVPVTIPLHGGDEQYAEDYAKFHDSDRSAINQIATIAGILVESGDPAVIGTPSIPYRGRSNRIYLLTPVEMKRLAADIFVKATPYQVKYWSLKDAIVAAKSKEEIPDIETMLDVINQT
jgi:hypothetical protein